MGKIVQREVKNWDDFESKLKEISAERDKLKQNSYCSPLLFRGQSKAKWKLETMLERYLGGQVLLEDYYRNILIAKPQFETFTGKEWDIPSWGEYQDWLDGFDYVNVFEFNKLKAIEYMVYLRHQGFPSPLLDWTRSPYIAAFFAFETLVENEPEDDVGIYACLEWAGAGKSTSSNNPVMSTPEIRVKTHQRHYLQQSDYTVCITKQDKGLIYESHEEAIKNSEQEQDLIWKLTVPKEEKLSFLERLDSMNITAYSLFGSEESLMRTVALREFKLRSIGRE